LSFDWYRFRQFDRATVRAAREPYLAHFAAGARLLDVGCGRGEFLEAAGEQGFDARGIDLDPAAIEATRAAGLAAEVADALDYLPEHPDAFDAIFCAHVIEHLVADDAARLIQAAAGSLRPGGVLCLVTPNPGSLPTITHEFWRDPSHTRPYDVEAMAFLCGQAGLEITASGLDESAPRGFAIDPDDLAPAEPAPPPAAPPAQQPRIAGAVAAQFDRSRLAAQLRAEIHAGQMRIEHLEDRLEQVTAALRRLVEVLYEPSEIYVVATRPASS
jgi:SAM-dependent methyltransferase